MFSRFPSLLVFIVAGLVISAAATPMAPPKDYDDGSKAPSYPGSSYSSPKYTADKPYAKPYAEEPRPKEKKYPEAKKYPEEKERYPEDKYSKEKHPEEKEAKQKYYPRAGPPFPGPRPKSPLGKYNNRPQNSNNCNVGTQMCCNQVNRSDNKDSQFQGILSGLNLMGDDDDDDGVTSTLKNKDKFIGKDCSPEGTGDQCKAKQMCCENNYFGGLLAIGCSDLDVTFPVDVVDLDRR